MSKQRIIGRADPGIMSMFYSGSKYRSAKENAAKVSSRLDNIRAEQMKKIQQRQKRTGDDDKH